MPCLQLNGGACSAIISTRGGALWSFDVLHHGQKIPMLVPRGNMELDGAGRSGCFPLVPFGNRLRGNGFSFEDREYALTPNTDADPLYLHGDGWLQDWMIDVQEADHVSLSIDMRGRETAPYCYRAWQHFEIRDDGLHLRLSITNHGDEALPYGYGWHPFFPLIPGTLLSAAASSYWLEGEQHLPTSLEPVPRDLDFTKPAAVPDRWINNCFEGWDGRAEILWPDHALALDISASDSCQHYVIYRPDRNVDPHYEKSFFCFEPMSHAIDAHHQQDGGGLVRLAPGETLEGRLVLTPRALAI